jgi:4-amino-4-deoxy-L-arabinose transferase-like glycosyltransferase
LENGRVPLINGVLAFLLRIIPALDLVVTSRLASIIASLFSLWFLVQILQDVFGRKKALAAGFFFAFLPYSIYYSRVILPEPFFIALSLGSLWLYKRHLQHNDLAHLLLSAVFFSLALLVKPMAVFFIPVFIGLHLVHRSRITLKDVIGVFLFGCACIPVLLWREWIKQYPTGIPLSAWLFNGVGIGTNLSPVYMIRFKPAWWRWLFYERLGKLFLGYIGILPFCIGILVSLQELRTQWKYRALFYLTWAISSFAYISVFAAGNVQHDYYQIPLVPFVSISCGIGIISLFGFLRNKGGKPLATLVCGGLVLGTLLFGWKRVEGYYHINNWSIIEAGKAADKLLPKDAKVIAPYGGDTAFLFQINRTGWPVGFDIDTKINEGAQYYISLNYDDETNDLIKKYHVIQSTKEYVIIELTQRQ